MTKKDKRTTCCMADLVKTPCSRPERCRRETIARIVRPLFLEGKVVDSGRQRRGQIVWVRPEFKQ
jgi:hypothetical protein